MLLIGHGPSRSPAEREYDLRHAVGVFGRDLDKWIHVLPVVNAAAAALDGRPHQRGMAQRPVGHLWLVERRTDAHGEEGGLNLALCADRNCDESHEYPPRT